MKFTDLVLLPALLFLLIALERLPRSLAVDNPPTLLETPFSEPSLENNAAGVRKDLKIHSPKLLDLLKEAAGVYRNPTALTSEIQQKLKKTVIVIATNHGFLDQVKNFDCFMRRLNLKYFVVALEKFAYDGLKATTTIPTYFHPTTVAQESFTKGTEQYAQIVRKKSEIVYSIMMAGYDVLFSDTDVAIARDPFPYLLWQNVDYVHSPNHFCDGSTYFYNRTRFQGNTGFYYLRSNPKTIKMWHDIIQAGGVYQNKTEQQFLWLHLLKSTDPPMEHHEVCRDQATESSAMVACMLDDCLFNQGALPSRRHNHYESYVSSLRARNETPVTIHATWILGNRKKFLILKDYGLWLANIQKNGSYSCGPLRIRSFGASLNQLGGSSTR